MLSVRVSDPSANLLPVSSCELCQVWPSSLDTTYCMGGVSVGIDGTRSCDVSRKNTKIVPSAVTNGIGYVAASFEITRSDQAPSDECASGERLSTSSTLCLPRNESRCPSRACTSVG